jgi:hypothetical protein
MLGMLCFMACLVSIVGLIGLVEGAIQWLRVMGRQRAQSSSGLRPSARP